MELATHLHNRLPAAGAQRHLYAPDRPEPRHRHSFPLDAAGDAVDSSLTAGLDVLRGGSSTSPVTTVRYTAGRLAQGRSRHPTRAATPGLVTSTIIVPDNFIVQGDTTSSGVSGLRVTLNLTYPNDPDLTLTLQHFDLNGDLLGSVPLATGVGSGTQQRPISPIRSSTTTRRPRFRTPARRSSPPTIPRCHCPHFAGMNAQGTWVLVVQNNSTTGGSRHHQQLVAQLPEARADLGPGRARRR